MNEFLEGDTVEVEGLTGHWTLVWKIDYLAVPTWSIRPLWGWEHRYEAAPETKMTHVKYEDKTKGL